jgi:hypothetical protein
MKEAFMETQIEKTLAALRARHINGVYTEDSAEACLKILSLIPKEAVVGMGDSTGVRQLGALQALKDRGTTVLNPFDVKISDSTPEAEERRQKIVTAATLCDVFLTGTNAITQDGKLVNVDAVGNRVAGMFWGHPTSIIVIGKNKIVKDLDEAFRRIRTLISPKHFWLRTELGGRKRKIPCSTTGECSDCRSVDRGCNIFTVIEGKPYRTEINVVIVNQDLGLGWDPSWPQDRITNIIENYKKSVWIPLPSK